MRMNEGAIPQQPMMLELVDVKKVIRTRVIDFNFEFTRETVMEVVRALSKVIEYDRIMKTPKELKRIRINVYSYGGHVDSLWALIDKIEYMKDHGYTVITHNVTVAMSCGFVLAVSGNVRTCTPYATYLNHQISAGTIGTYGEMQNYVVHLDEAMSKFKEYIKKQTHMTDEEIDRPYTTNRDVYYTPCEALKWEIANEIKSYEN